MSSLLSYVALYTIFNLSKKLAFKVLIVIILIGRLSTKQTFCDVWIYF